MCLINGIGTTMIYVFKTLAHNFSMNYNMSKQEQYVSYINDQLLVVQNK
jgi:hypothetical protein